MSNVRHKNFTTDCVYMRTRLRGKALWYDALSTEKKESHTRLLWRGAVLVFWRTDTELDWRRRGFAAPRTLTVKVEVNQLGISPCEGIRTRLAGCEPRERSSIQRERGAAFLHTQGKATQLSAAPSARIKHTICDS